MPDAALDGGDERRDLGAEIAAVEAVLVSPDVSKLNAGCDDKGGGEGVERSLPPRSAWKPRGVNAERKLKTFSRARSSLSRNCAPFKGASFGFIISIPESNTHREVGYSSREFVLSRWVIVIFTGTK